MPQSPTSVVAGGTQPTDAVTLCLTGDVMTGRGIDQILPHPGDPRLYESYVRSATGYVRFAEEANGAIAKPVDYAYVWGDALDALARRAPDVRIINLETAVTTSAEAAPKGINYRMAPQNAPVLTAARVDCCTLANNHVLDWGAGGLAETLDTLADIGIASAGAGRSLQAAQAPAELALAGHGRVLVYACGMASSGIPRTWAAGPGRPGVNLLPDLSARTVDGIAQAIGAVRRRTDVVVFSIHWGPNWGHAVPEKERGFAHALIEQAGVDVVHGHSSHHAKALELHRGRLVLYGCGDFLNDYEGIGGYESYRGDLALLYLPAIRSADGVLLRLTMVPLQIRNLRLNHASRADAIWLRDTLNREGTGFGTPIRLAADNALVLTPP